MGWTLNGSDIATYGASRASVTYRNAAPDVLELLIPLTVNAPSGVVMGSTGVLALDGTVVFRGTLDEAGRDADGRNHYLILRYFGAWARWQRTMRIVTVSRRNGSDVGNYISTQSGSFLTGAWSVGAAIKSTINIAPSIATIGSIYDAAIELPAERVTNLTIADLMRKWLSYYGSYWSWFNYAGSPPSWNLSVDNRNYFTVLNVASEIVKQISMRQRTSSRLSGVIVEQTVPITYYTNADMAGNAQSVTHERMLVRSDKYPPGTYPEQGIDYAAKSVDLNGSVQVWDTLIRSSSLSLAWALATGTRNGNHHSAISDLFVASGIPASAAFTNVDRYLTVGQFNVVAWESTDRDAAVTASDARMLLTGKPMAPYLGSGGYRVARIAWMVTNDRGETASGECYVRNGAAFYVRHFLRVDSGDVVGAAGIAQALYESSLASRWSGTVVLRRTWGASLINKVGGLIVPSYGPGGDFRCLQQISYDLLSDDATFTFAETPDRTPDDLISMLREK